MSRPIPELEIPNPAGACWTCVERQEQDTCDRQLPACAVCTGSGRVCEGYHARLRWTQRARRTPDDVLLALAAPVSTLGLPPREDRLMQHYLKNLSRISLAIDYDGNGYRRLVSVGINDAALLNVLLATSQAHLDRLQGKSASRSRVYIRRALEQLHQRFETPELLRSESTFMTVIMLLTYELCEGNDQWKQHFSAAISWIRACQESTIIDPLLTTILSMVATNVLLHTPAGSSREESYQILEMLMPNWVTCNAVEVMLGGSVILPQLIMEAGRLQDDLLRAKELSDPEMLRDAVIRANKLQRRIKSTQLSPIMKPQLCLLAKTKERSQGYDALRPANPYEDFDVLEAARSSAEIFRYALHVYVHRIIHEPVATSIPIPIVQEAVSQTVKLLPLIPDTSASGSFLGWALVVIGAEMDALDHRAFIKRRLETMTLLAVNHGFLALNVLDELWRRKDSLRLGTSQNRRLRWQEVMEDMMVDLALV